MTVSRRSRRKPPQSDPEERLRALGLDASPTARRLRARIPRASTEPSPEEAVPSAPYAIGEAITPYRPGPARPTPAELWSATPEPRGPAARGGQGDTEGPEEAPTVRLRLDRRARRPSPRTPPAQSPWREPPPRGEPEDGWAPADEAPRSDTHAKEPSSTSPDANGERETTPPAQVRGEGPGHLSRVTRADRDKHPASVSWNGDSGHGPADPPEQEQQNGPRPRSGGGTRDGRGGRPSSDGRSEGSGPEPPSAEEPEGPSGGRHRRRPEAARPPSGYTELDPDAPGTVLDRVAERWGPQASLSRRAVAALLVLGLIAVAGAFLVLRERPGEVTVPELVNQSAAAGQGQGDHASTVPDGAGQAPGSEGGGPDAAPSGDVVVHVGGEVAEPGIYTMPAGSRVADAVEEAGGPLPDADLDLVNLARTLNDGERILVGVPQAEGEAGAGPEGSGSLVNLNQAGQAELETLPGIGEKKAQKIIRHRESLGGSFGSVEDLLGVDGIAEKTFSSLEPLVTVG